MNTTGSGPDRSDPGSAAAGNQYPAAAHTRSGAPTRSPPSHPLIGF